MVAVLQLPTPVKSSTRRLSLAATVGVLRAAGAEPDLPRIAEVVRVGLKVLVDFPHLV